MYKSEDFVGWFQDEENKKKNFLDIGDLIQTH